MSHLDGEVPGAASSSAPKHLSKSTQMPQEGDLQMSTSALSQSWR
jgi:hypothetical protein